VIFFIVNRFAVVVEAVGKCYNHIITRPNKHCTNAGQFAGGASEKAAIEAVFFGRYQLKVCKIHLVSQ